MINIPLLNIPVPDTVLDDIGNSAAGAAESAGSAALSIAGNPLLLVGGIVLVIAALVIFFFLKKIIINSILGIVAWAILTFVFQVELPFIPSLAISVIFGLAGIGAMLVMKFFGMF